MGHGLIVIIVRLKCSMSWMVWWTFLRETKLSAPRVVM